MSEDTQDQTDHAFERAITTLCNCRSLIRHHPDLAAIQREQLLSDIDQTLELLQGCAARAAQEALFSAGPVPQRPSPEQSTLRALYQLYQEHINSSQASTQVLSARFNETLTTLKEIQDLIQECDDLDLAGDRQQLSIALQRVGAFTADLYCLFMEFRRSLAAILDEQSSYIHTEELSSLQRLRPAASERQSTPALRPPHVREDHRRLDEQRQVLTSRLTDATAFLIMLEEGLRSDLKRRNEIISHLHSIGQLLRDMAGLLAGYEETLRAIL
ncbi:hypothetical protein [Thermogemmatispora tikiterensis]|uniref:Uncharacterized protein n=1 Tax=Thermogemmatispora tikiterensis TaxID=1825093 RepID=A0A328VJ27_9CHLR|nr:hypothetical protein [Thermogemmatispora tikiterensis]RAQ95673.1 hypothetical protein A4R35_09020 [Thermogemmatispora tikiterensis]